MPRVLVIATILTALVPGVASGTDAVVVAGGAVPRLEPFSVRAVPCDDRSCLDITWRVRGGLGPRLIWDMTVLPPRGPAVFRGSGVTTRGRRVSGLLHPSRPPRCGRYRVTLRVEDHDGDHLQETRTVVRRTRCVPPARR